jgi:hypothetical protein
MDNPFSDYGVSDAELEKVLNSSEVKAGKVKLAEEAAVYWRSISPVGTPGKPDDDPHPGRYLASIEVKVTDKVRVGSALEEAVYLEYGTVDTPEFALRIKTQEHFGGGVTDGRGW